MKSPDTQPPGAPEYPGAFFLAGSRMSKSDANRLRRFCATLALLPEGRELLDFARTEGVTVEFRADSKMGGDLGETSRPASPEESCVVTLNRTAADGCLLIVLAHELRHAQQFHLLKRNGVCDWGPREEIFFTRLIETDAYTFGTIIALELKKIGKPEFYEAMNDAATERIREYLSAHPPERFKDRQALARGLFTHLALHPMDSYTASVLNYVTSVASFPPDGGEKNLPLDKIKGSGLDRLYGTSFVAKLPMRALKAGFLQTWSAWDRATVRASEKMRFSADAATKKEKNRRERFLSLRTMSRELEPEERREKMAGRTFGTYGVGNHLDGSTSKLFRHYAKKNAPRPREPWRWMPFLHRPRKEHAP